MKSKLLTLTLFITILTLGGCARLMFGVSEKSGMPEIKVPKGEELIIHLPTVEPSLLSALSKAKFTENGYASLVQQDLVLEFNRRDVKATEGEGTSGNYLKVHINEYKKGIGLFRRFYIPLLTEKLGRTKLRVTSTLYTPEGSREIEVRKRGASKGGKGASSDQTKYNIETLAKRTAGSLIK